MTKAFVQRCLYFVFLTVSLAGFTFSTQLGIHPGTGLLACGAAMLATIVVLEVHLPFQKKWRQAHGDIWTDASSALVLVGLIDPALKVILPLLAIDLLNAFSVPSKFSIGKVWDIKTNTATFWLAVLLALLFSEFAKYWAHRLHHHVKSLWWLHAMHHSSERLYWLNGFRFHPLNHVINTTLSLLPLWLIGTPILVILAVQAITLPILLMQHANIDLRSGDLNAWLSTNESHRCHHSKHGHQANANYGSALLLWDHVFGTFRPANVTDSWEELGLFESSRAYPARLSYWKQLQSIFGPSCC